MENPRSFDQPKHKGVHFDRRGSFWPSPGIFAEYLDCDFHMYVYGTLLEILERYFEIEASRVIPSFPKINIPTDSGENWKNGECDITWSLPPPSVTNCHTFSDPLPPWEHDILYGWPLVPYSQQNLFVSVSVCTCFQRRDDQRNSTMSETNQISLSNLEQWRVTLYHTGHLSGKFLKLMKNICFYVLLHPQCNPNLADLLFSRPNLFLSVFQWTSTALLPCIRIVLGQLFFAETLQVKLTV